LKIAQITPYFLPVEGGVERHVLNLSKELVRLGHEVDIFTCSGTRNGERLPAYDYIEGLNVQRFRSVFSLGEFGRVWPGFLSKILNGGYDVLHAHAYRHPHTDLSRLAARVTGSGCVLTAHSPFHPNGVRASFAGALVGVYDELIAKVSLRSFDRIVSLTQAEARILESLGGERRKIVVIPHGVEQVHFERAGTWRLARRLGLDGNKVVLYLGRINRTKGLHTLVEAFSLVSKQSPEAVLVIAGPSSNEEEDEYLRSLQRSSADLGVGERVIFTGKLNEDDKLSAYDLCSVFVLPSVYEPYGIVLLEAAAHGKPLLSSRTDGPLSIVRDGENGYTFAPGDPYELAQRMAQLLSDEDLAARLGDNARVLAMGYSWEKVARETLNAYESCAS